MSQKYLTIVYSVNETTDVAASHHAREWIASSHSHAIDDVRALKKENANLRAGYDAARLEIASLQAQLEAVGAGGVSPLIGASQAQPAGQALNSVRVFWQQHTQADALSMTMAELHDDVELAIRAARGAAQAAPVDAAVQEDAARWQFLAEYLVGPRTDLDDEIVGCDSVQKMAGVIDAAIAAQKGGAA